MGRGTTGGMGYNPYCPVHGRQGGCTCPGYNAGTGAVSNAGYQQPLGPNYIAPQKPTTVWTPVHNTQTVTEMVPQTRKVPRQRVITEMVEVTENVPVQRQQT